MSALITLLSDFGDVDPFVGIMKGVINGICPTADIVDLTHGIEPQNVLVGSIVWQPAVPYFPPGTIHLGVVDPGVGTSRLPIAVRAGGDYFVCPDNGLITYLARERAVEKIVALDNPAYRLPQPSRTFHARDIFSPAAAHLAAGVRIEDLGSPLTDFVRFTPTDPSIRRDFMIGHIVYFDAFGNAYTDITEDRFKEWAAVKYTSGVGRTSFDKVSTSYADGERGGPLAIFASHGRLEIAVRNGNARTALGLNLGDEVRLDRIA